MTSKIFLLFAFLATFAFCYDTNLTYPFMSGEEQTAVQAIEDYYTGYFGHFNLSTPSQIINCYTPRDAGLFFTSIYEFNEILKDINRRDSWHLHWRILEEKIIGLLEIKVSECIIQTKEFSDLLKALGIDKTEIKLFAYGNLLYIQAHYTKLLEQFKPIIDNILAHNFTEAGAAEGALAKDVVDNIKKEGFGYLYIASFENGFAMGANVNNPNDSLTAWNHTTGGLAMQFLSELADWVTRGHWMHSFKNTIKFMKFMGVDILEKIPASVWECLDGSNDNKALTKKLGINVISKEFGHRFGKWMMRHQLKYYVHLRGIKDSIDRLQFIHAGSNYAKMVRAVARTRSEEAEEIAEIEAVSS